jgi:hypothetical protein
MVEGMGLENMISRSSSMASPSYKMSFNSTDRFKSCTPTHLSSLNVRHFGVIYVTFNVITSIKNVIQIHQSV